MGDVTVKVDVPGHGVREEAPRDVSHFLYCMVFPGEEGDGKTMEELNAYREAVVDEIIEAGLVVEQFWSVQDDEIFVKIGATDARLLREADHIEYKLALEESSMRAVALSSKDAGREPLHLEPPYDSNQIFKKHKGGTQWRTMSEKEIHHAQLRRTHLSPFEQLHARYNDQWEMHHKEVNGVQIYKTYRDGTILRVADRIKLIKVALERTRHEHVAPGGIQGAGLNLSEMQFEGSILAVFPMQTVAMTLDAEGETVDQLHDRWATLKQLPWRQPIQGIRDYFGEKIALYFAFLGHYTMWLLAAGLVGLVVFGHQMYNTYRGKNSFNFLNPATVTNETGEWETIVWSEVWSTGFYAFFVSLWGTFMLEFWKRKESRLALKWGMSDFEAAETSRPEFKSTHYLPNIVTGKSQAYYSETTFIAKVSTSFTIIGVCVGVVIAAVGGIFVLKVALAKGSVPSFEGDAGNYAALVVNAVAIQILGGLYKVLAKVLNDWENHRTDTAYEDSLITKTFLFSFVNSYATLFYMAYVKSVVPILGERQVCIPEVNDNPEARDACFGAIGYSLFIIFGTQIVVNNFMEIVVPAVGGYMTRRSNLKTKKKAKGDAADKVGEDVAQDEEKQRMNKTKTKSPAEDQFYKKAYEGTFGDFLEIALQFGYATLFVVAFPLAPLFAYVNNMLEIRVDAFKLCKLSRRPEIAGAQDIGSWGWIFYVMGIISVVSNSAIVCFNSSILPRPPGFTDDEMAAFRVWMFMFFVVFTFSIKIIADSVLLDVPREVAIQLQREKYIVRKCLLIELDDDSDDEGDAAAAEAVTGGQRKSQRKKGTNAEHHDVTIHTMDPDIDKLLSTAARNILAANAGVSDFESIFNAADKNKNGTISIKEFSTLVRGAGGYGDFLTDTQIEVLSEALDNNGNGEIDFHEFFAFLDRAKTQLA